MPQLSSFSVKAAEHDTDQVPQFRVESSWSYGVQFVVGTHTLLFCLTGEIFSAAGIHCVPAELCSLQRTHLTVNSTQRTNFCCLQYHLHANTAEHSEVK
jgi:hypothetical protein